MSKACEHCEQPSNNKFSNCAPRMQDGRNFTDYRPRCIANFENVGGNQNPSSYEYRQYLVANASEIMMKNKQAAYKQNRCGPCMNPYNQGTMLPEQSLMKCDTNTCSFKLNDHMGIGLGRDYGYPDNKEFKAAKNVEQEMLANYENCCATTNDDELYYAFDYKPSGIANERPSVPSGGMIMNSSDRM